MRFAATFGQKYNYMDHATLGEEVTGNSYLLVVAPNETQARLALSLALPTETSVADYAFLYEFDEDFQRQINDYDLKPLSRCLLVDQLGQFDFQLTWMLTL